MRYLFIVIKLQIRFFDVSSLLSRNIIETGNILLKLLSCENIPIIIIIITIIIIIIIIITCAKI